MKLVYIAGPYRGKSEAEVHDHIQAARSYAVRVWQAGAVAVCPHLNTAFMGGAVEDSAFLKGAVELMSRCDAVLAIPGHERSKGSLVEVKVARDQGMPVLTDLPSLMKWISQ